MVTIAEKMIRMSGVSSVKDKSQFEMRKRSVQTKLRLLHYNAYNDFGVTACGSTSINNYKSEKTVSVKDESTWNYRSEKSRKSPEYCFCRSGVPSGRRL